METKEGEYIKKKGPINRRPTLMEKRTILESIQKGERPAEEILKEYGIKSIVSVVIRRWEKELERQAGRIRPVNKSYTEDFKKDIVRQIELGVISEKEVISRFSLSGSGLIRYWLKRYSSQIVYVSEKKEMSEAEKTEVAEIKRQNKSLEKALEGANLRIVGLETMIDIAEKELKIDIRKKAGTKQ